MDSGVIFYDLVVSHGSRQLIKYQFNKDHIPSTPVELVLFRHDVVIPTEYLHKSSRGTYSHLIDVEDNIHIHVNKVINRDDHFGYVRRFGEHSEQDVPICTITPGGVKDRDIGGLSVRVPSSTTDTTYEPLEEVKVRIEQEEGGYGVDGLGVLNAFGVKAPPHVKGKNMRWLTTRGFFGSCHVTSSDELQLWDVRDIILLFFNNHAKTEFRDVKHLLITIGETFFKTITVYKDDVRFNDPNVPQDAGDAKLELSGAGDCEDMTHFYMRVFRLIMSVFRFWCKGNGSSLFTHCAHLAERYVPMCYVCRVKEKDGTLDYHCTMLLVPYTSEHKPISFEVTDPNASYDLSIKEDRDMFTSWHIESFFLLDAEHIFRIQDPTNYVDGKMEDNGTSVVLDISIDKIKGKAFNY